MFNTAHDTGLKILTQNRITHIILKFAIHNANNLLIGKHTRQRTVLMSSGDAKIVKLLVFNVFSVLIPTMKHKEVKQFLILDL